MKKILFALLGAVGLVVLASAAVFVYVQKADLAPLVLSQIEKNTGLKVQASQLRLKLWPAIDITAENVHIPAPTGGGELASLDSLHLRARWGGPLRIWRGMALEDLTVTNPTVHAVIDAQGRPNWALPNRQTAQHEEPEEKSASPATDLTAFVSSFGVVNITNLNATYEDKTKSQTTKLANTNLKLDATDLANLGLNLTGTVNGNPLKVQARTEAGQGTHLKTGGTYPLQLGVQLANLKAAVTGSVDTAKQAFDGNVKAESASLAATAAAVLGKAPANVPAQPLTLSAAVQANPKAVDVTGLNATLGNLLQAAGNLNVTLGATPALSAKNLDVKGNNLKALVALADPARAAKLPAQAFALKGDMQASAQNVVLKGFDASINGLLEANGDVNVALGKAPSAQGTITAKGANLRTLAALAAPDAAKVPAQPFSVTATFDGKDTIELKSFNATLGSLLTAQGKGTYTPASGAMQGTLSAMGSSLAALAQSVGVTQPLPAEAFTLAATVSGKPTALALSHTKLTLTNIGTVVLNGTLTPLDVSVQATGPSTRALAKGLGMATGGLPESGFDVQAKVKTTGATTTLDDLSLNLPGLVQGVGNAAYTGGDMPNVDATLKLKTLNLTALGPTVGDICTAKAPNTKEGGTDVKQASAQTAAANPLPDTPLPLDTLKKTAFTLNVDAPTVACDAYKLTALKAYVKNTASTLTASLNATLSGQAANLDATLEHTGTPQLKGTFRIPDLPIQDYVGTLAARGVQLPLTFTGNVQASGASARALAANLNGNLSAKATQGQLPYKSLLGNAAQLAQLLGGGAAVSQPSGAVDNVTAEFDATNGLLTAKTLTASTDNGYFTMNGTGTVNLRTWLIDMSLSPQLRKVGALNNGNALEVPVRITGSLSAPAIGPDPAFTAKIGGKLLGEGLKALGVDKATAKGIGGLLGGQGSGKDAVGNLLNNVLGGTKAQTPASDTQQSAPQSQQQTTPNDALKNAAGTLLQGILNGK